MKRVVDVDWLDDWLREAEEAATRQRKYVLAGALNTIRGNLKHVPTVEVIRCNECKYQDEGYRRIAVRWLPCMEVKTGSNWYCGSAERKND